MRLLNLLLIVPAMLSANCGGRTGLDALPMSVGGAVSAGGEKATGGATATAGAVGAGCTGNFETTQVNTGLCVAKMATIWEPVANLDYSIDVTEVTKGQYDAWLATSPALPARTDVNCGYVSSYAEQGTDGVYTGPDADHHPVVYVDWCDAYAYCLGVGKRLCGAIGGGSNSFASYNDEKSSQWFRACSFEGAYTYPYGNTYEASYCNGDDYWIANWNDNGPNLETVAVGSFANCVSPTGAYDLSGNVYEWEDSCESNGPAGHCRIRGGAMGSDRYGLACGTNVANIRYGSFDNYVGFRCCSQ